MSSMSEFQYVLADSTWNDNSIVFDGIRDAALFLDVQGAANIVLGTQIVVFPSIVADSLQ